jgi:hypothetical protein
MNKAANILIEHAPRKYGQIFGYITPSSLTSDQLPDINEVSLLPKTKKVLLTHTYAELIHMNGFITSLRVHEIWNIVKKIQYYYDDIGGELIDDLIVIHILCKYYECIPYSGFPSEFDCQLNLHQNMELGYMDRSGLLHRRIEIDFDVSDDAKSEIKRIDDKYIEVNQEKFLKI